MKERRLGELTEEEFDQMTQYMLSEDFEKLTPEEFFGALAAIDEGDAQQQVVELIAHLENGEFIFDEPALLPVRRNQVLVGNKRLVIKLQQEISERSGR